MSFIQGKTIHGVGGQCLPSSLFLGDLGLERALWSPGSSPGEQEVIGWGCTADLFRKNRERGHCRRRADPVFGVGWLPMLCFWSRGA